MKLTTVLSYALLPLVLLVIAWAVRTQFLWSSVARQTVPWFCSALALAVAVVGAVAVASGRPPSEMTRRAVLLVYVPVVLLLAGKLILDGWGEWENDPFILSAAEWLGFSILLLIVFVVPRLKARRRDSSGPSGG